MKVGSLVRYSGLYGSDTFEVVTLDKAAVTVRALTSTATRAKGEVFDINPVDVWVYRQ